MLGAALVLFAPSGTPLPIYALSVVVLFGTSALYHRIDWGSVAARLRRLDHSAIFLLIAGTYTPFALLAARRPARRRDPRGGVGRGAEAGS